jgi:hypothetical protein
MNFIFYIRHMKGKENSVVYFLNRKMHVETIIIFTSYLNIKVIESLSTDEDYF